MFGLSMGELLIVGMVVLLLFGSKRLPQLGKSLGAAITNFKKGLKDGEEEKKVSQLEDPNDKDQV